LSTIEERGATKNAPLSFGVGLLRGIAFPLVTISHADRIGKRFGASWKYVAQDFLVEIGGLGLIADFTLPLWWAVGATFPILAASWWIAYRSDWF